MTKIYYLYSLLDSTKEPRYVGKTTSSLNHRLYHHKWGVKTRKYQTWCANWIRSLNYNIAIELIEECEDSIWEERERFYIKEYGELYNLVNLSIGGFGGYKLFGSTNPKAVQVAQYSLEGDLLNIFSSLIEAEKETRVKYTQISNCICLDRVKSGGNFQWLKVEEGVNPKLKIELYKPNYTHHIEQQKKVTKYIEEIPIEEYNSISEAAKMNNVSYGNMKNMVKNESLFNKNIRFKKNDLLDRKIKKPKKYFKVFKEKELLGQYKSILDASKKLKISRQTLQSIIDGKIYKYKSTFQVYKIEEILI